MNKNVILQRIRVLVATRFSNHSGFTACRERLFAIVDRPSHPCRCAPFSLRTTGHQSETWRHMRCDWL